MNLVCWRRGGARPAPGGPGAEGGGGGGGGFSPLGQQELLYFLMGQDMEANIARAVVYEAEDFVKQAQQRLEDLEQAVEAVREDRRNLSPGGGSGLAAAQASLEASSTEGLRLRSEMQRCVEEERYSEAADLRDKLRKLEERVAEANATIGEWGVSGYGLEVGQCVQHSDGWRGVVCGRDPSCCEDEAWFGANVGGSSKLGPNQPYYHVLVDINDVPMGGTSTEQEMVAYVPEDCLTVPVPPATWRSSYGEDDIIQHPFVYLLFYGKDGEGNYVPTKALRNRFKLDRRDVYLPGEGGADDTPLSGPD